MVRLKRRCISRSENMRRIRSKNTGPELIVRRLLRELGFSGYRINYKKLPGRPDIVYVRKKKVIFVNGCFWHGHDCHEGVRKPKTNRNYWLPKIEATRKRDAEHISKLIDLGWECLIIWECELTDREKLVKKIVEYISSDPN